MSFEEVPFGQEVYAALEAHGRVDVLTPNLKYAQIQAFKKASRVEIRDLFWKSRRKLAEQAMTATPTYFAAYFTGYFDSGALTPAEILLILAAF